MSLQDYEDWMMRVYSDYSWTILIDTPVSFAGGVKKSVVVNDTETGLEFSDAEPDNHSARHEEGGADEISVTGLDGMLNQAGNVSFPDRSSWLICLSSNQNISVGNIEKVELDTVLYDNRGEFDSDNNRIVVDDPGFYWVSVSLLFAVDSDKDQLFLYLRKNDTRNFFAVVICASGIAQHSICGSIGIYLNAGDFLELYAKNNDNNDTVISSNNSTLFSGCKVA